MYQNKKILQKISRPIDKLFKRHISIYFFLSLVLINYYSIPMSISYSMIFTGSKPICNSTSNSFFLEKNNPKISDNIEIQDCLGYSNQNLLEFDFFCNISTYSSFFEDQLVYLHYSLYYIKNTSFFYTLSVNNTIKDAKSVNQPYFQFDCLLNTESLGFFKIQLDIYSSNITSIDNLNQVDLEDLFFQNIIFVEIIENNETDINPSNSIPFSLNEIIKNIQVLLYLGLGTFGIIALVNIQYFITQFRLKRFSKLLLNPRIKYNLKQIKQEEPLINHKNHNNILKFCINSYSEFEIDPYSSTDLSFWTDITKGGLDF